LDPAVAGAGARAGAALAAPSAQVAPALGKISVFLADDNLIVREGVRALLALEDDLDVVGAATDYDGLVRGAAELAPQVVVTDIRMPPSFQREGIEAAHEIRKRHPGTGIVVLSQFDEPEYAISLLGDGAAGYAYLLKDRVAQSDQLARAVRAVASGGSVLDDSIVDTLVHPVTTSGELSAQEEALLRFVAEGRPIKAIAVTLGTTPSAAADAVEHLFLKIAAQASSGSSASLRRLRMLHQAIVNREEQGETLSRLLPGGVAELMLSEGGEIGNTVDLVVSVVMSDIRGYSSIAETSNPSVLAGQLNTHRAEMNRAILDRGGTVMQFVGDAVMAVFGAPFPIEDHADRAVAASLAMHEAQRAVNQRWEREGLPPFGLGIGVTTGPVAAALLGSEQHLEYTLVGDTVNLAQRIQQWASPGETAILESTFLCLSAPPATSRRLPAQQVKGRTAPVQAYLVPAATG
jgi:class 3 adenylate cyclase/FixJ family two-component response regulator